MGESDKKEQPQNQAAAAPLPTTTEVPNQIEAEARLDHARRFLRDGEVRLSSTEKKTEFLKEKGFTETDIQTLLAEGTAAGHDSSSAGGSPTAPTTSGSSSTAARDVSEVDGDRQQEKEDNTEKRAPIVTYPEFLAKPARPPPLITPTRFLNTLYGFAGLATAVYGASQFVVAPMVASTTDARIELHETALKGLSGLVAKLESVVSEIPPAISHPQPPKTGGSSTSARRRGGATVNDDDDASSCEDPTEMFHRDVGVQTTSPPPSPPSRVNSQDEAELGSAADVQAARIGSLTRSLRAVRQDLVSEGEDYDDLKAVLNTFNGYLDRLKFPARTASFGGSGAYPYNPYGVSSSSTEPDDEVKRVKENIRSVKGILLSARSFPAGSR